MAMYSITDIKAGLTVIIDGQLYSISSYEHVKPGKGSAIARIRLRNLKLGTVIERTFRDADRIEGAHVEQRTLQYSYNSEHLYHFTDLESYEEVMLSAEQLGDTLKFLKHDMELNGYFYGNELVNIALPNFVNYKIKATEPGVRGDRAKSGMKPAELETGAVIQVPLFVDAGETVRVDTRTGTYIERV